MATPYVDLLVSAKAAAAVLTAFFGLFAIAGGPRRTANVALGIFLILIAGNLGAEAVRQGYGQLTALNYQWGRVATVFAALDPFLLYYFASVFPRRNALHRTRYLAPLALVAGSLALIAGWGPSEIVPRTLRNPFFNLWSIYTAVAYAAVLLHVRVQLAADRPRSSLRFLYVALAFVALPAASRTMDTVFGLGAYAEPYVPTGVSLVLLALPVALLGALMFRARPGQDRLPQHARRAAVWGLVGGATFALMNASWLVFHFLGVGGRVPTWLTVSLGVNTDAVRWILFGLLASMALVRHDVLGVSLTMRRRAARGVVAMAFLAVAGGVLLMGRTWLGNEAGDLRAMDVVVIALVLVTAQQFRGLIDRTAERIYAVPMPGDLAAATETYRVAADQAAREGRDPHADPELTRLREELGLDQRTANVLERMALASRDEAIAQGATLVGRYHVMGLLGEGGAGRVFLARDELLERDVVLKEIAHDGQGAAEAALNEARIAGEVSHPNVVTLHDVLQLRSRSVLVSEYVEGGTLADRIDEGPLPVADAVRVGRDVLAGLAAVHERGVVHRDLKPANVLLAPDGTAKIADFGIARVRTGVTQTVDEAGLFAGTPAYMAPEQREGRVATPATDLYAVGLLLDAALPEERPEAVQAVLERALEDAPTDRWPDAATMVGALAATTSATP